MLKKFDFESWKIPPPPYTEKYLIILKSTLADGKVRQLHRKEYTHFVLCHVKTVPELKCGLH